MIVKKGIGASPGVAIAPAVILETEDFEIPLRHIGHDRIRGEIDMTHRAVECRRRSCRTRDTGDRAAGKERRPIFDFNMALIQDRNCGTKFHEAVITIMSRPSMPV